MTFMYAPEDANQSGCGLLPHVRNVLRTRLQSCCITAAAGAPLRAVRQIYLGAEARRPTGRSGRSLKESPRGKLRRDQPSRQSRTDHLPPNIGLVSARSLIGYDEHG